MKFSVKRLLLGSACGRRVEQQRSRRPLVALLVMATLVSLSPNVAAQMRECDPVEFQELAPNRLAPDHGLEAADQQREDVLVAPCNGGGGPGPDPDPDPEPLPITFRQEQFRRGDNNVDGLVDLSDGIWLLEAIILGTRELTCVEASDMNLDGRSDPTDAILLLEYVILGAAPPPDPGPFECDIDRDSGTLGCVSHTACEDDFQLISHVLNRITFGPTLELYSLIQTREDLVRYVEDQLKGPDNYDPGTDEPALAAEIDALGIGFQPYVTPRGQYNRIKGELVVSGIQSDRQLLQVMAFFWNNHFHTQVDTLRQNFFGRNRLGGGSTPPTAAIFTAADIDGAPDGFITEAEWEAFRLLHPAAMPYGFFPRNDRLSDEAIDFAEFMTRNVVGYWKYGRGTGQQGISAEMESREFDVFRRLAFGSFGDLLEASAKSVAMTIYLNNYENTVTAPNENYGREYLELYALGVNNMYTQRDIEEIAKVFTGWIPGWVRRSDLAANDDAFMSNPGTSTFITTLREGGGLNFPDTSNWDDATYVWAFTFGHRFNVNGVPRDNSHDWGSKTIFAQQFGGTDSLGRLVTPADLINLPAVAADQPFDTLVGIAMDEYATVHDKITHYRDVAKYISSKLIAFFVNDDFTQLSKDEPMLPEMVASFNGVDSSADVEIDLDEWFAPLPPFLPNGRPLEKFSRLDANEDGIVTRLEYQEPDLLVAAIAAWQGNDGNIRDVLRTVLLSDEFLSLKHYRAKVKNPLTLVTSTARILEGALGLDQLFVATLEIGFMGQELYDFADPTGESDRGDKVMHTVGLLERLKYVNRSANPATGGEIRMIWDPITLEADWQLDNSQTAVDFLSLLIHNGDILNNHRSLAFNAYDAAADGFAKITTTAAYLLSLPDFEKR